MPRNSNGQYTLPAGNPVVSGEVISTSWANPTMEDIAAEMTNSLDRNGRGGMLAPFKNADGTQSNPGMTWGNEPTTGFYRAGGQDMRAVIGGNLRMRWNNDGAQLWNGTIWSPVVSDATLEANLTAKGYARKASNEAITGQWTFSALQTFSTQVKIGNGTASPGAKLLVNSLSTEAAQIQLFRDTVASWLIGPTAASGDFSFSESGVEKFRVSGGGAVVTGTFSASGNGSFGGTLGVTGVATLSAGAVLTGGARFTSDGAVLGPNFGGTDNVLRWLMGRDPGTNNLRFYRYDTAGAFLNTPLTIDSAGNVQMEGALSTVGTITQNGTAVAVSSTTITGANTITGGGSLAANRTLQLVNDVASPGSSWYYGTDAAGAKGWFPLSGVVGVPEAPIDGQSYARQNASWVSLGSAGSQYVLKTGDTMTGALTVQMVEAMTVWLSTNAAPDSNRFSIHNGNGQVAFRCSNAPWDAHDDFINVVRTQDTYTIHSLALKGGASIVATTPQFRVGPSGNVYNPVTGPTRWIGLVAEAGNSGEIGVYANDGVNEPRAALFAHPTAVGIDWTFSTGVATFSFKRAGAPIFNYDGNGINVVEGKQVAFLQPDNAAWTILKMNAGGVMSYNAPLEHAFQTADTNRVLINGSQTDHYYGHGTRWLSGDNSFGTTLRMNAQFFDITGSGLDHIRMIIDGSNEAFSFGSALNLRAGRGANFWSSDNSTNGSVVQSGGTLIMAGSGGLRFDVGGTPYGDISSGAWNVYSAYPLRLYGPGNVVSAGLINDASSGSAVLKLEGRGGVLHWEPSNLYASRINIGTTDPGTTGEPGLIYLVYE